MRPTKAHYLRTLAQTANEPTEPLAGLQGYELVLAQLTVHRRQLKQIQSVSRKIAFKRSVFDEYRPWIEGSLAKGSGSQDAVLMTMFVWAMDIGDYHTALAIASYALLHDLAMPEQFERDVATTLVEELATAAKTARDQKQPFDATVLQQALDLTKGRDMPDPVQAKLLRELGELIQENDPHTALNYYQTAVQLDSQCGAKGLRDKLEKRLAKQE